MNTLDHYNRTADRYIETTRTLDMMNEVRDTFISQVLRHAPAGRVPRVLDAGSGSGRDTKAFLDAGLRAEAFDGSPDMAARSSAWTGVPTKVMRFENLTLPEQHYDGIWACASLLHVPRGQMPEVMTKLQRAMRPGGVLFASFKYGDEERQDAQDGRAFTDMNEQRVTELLAAAPGWKLSGASQMAGPDTVRGRGNWFFIWLQQDTPALTSEPEAPVMAARRRRPG
jgi:SAM-dependent methyltransferase